MWTKTDLQKTDRLEKKQTNAWFSCGANLDVFSSHTPAKVSTCSSEEPNPPWITGRLGLDYAASENPSQRAAIISIRGDSGPHLLPHRRREWGQFRPNFEHNVDILKAEKKTLGRIIKMKFDVGLTFLIFPHQRSNFTFKHHMWNMFWILYHYFIPWQKMSPTVYECVHGPRGSLLSLQALYNQLYVQ